MNQFILHCFNSSIFNSPNQLDRDSNRFLRSSSPFTGFAGKRHCRLRFLRSHFLCARFRFRSSKITNFDCHCYYSSINLRTQIQYEAEEEDEEQQSKSQKIFRKYLKNLNSICYSYL